MFLLSLIDAPLGLFVPLKWDRVVPKDRGFSERVSS